VRTAGRAPAVGLVDMLRAGARAVADYTGTVFAVFLVQVLMAGAATLAFAQLFATAFATRPLFDDGVDGDLAALIEALRNARPLLDAIGWIAFAAIVFWALLSWFLHAGVLTVLIERPDGRRDTARAFGGGGAASFFAFARLGLWSIAVHSLLAVVALLGLDAVFPRIETALTFGEALGALVLGLAPALVLLALWWTIVDYARVELVLRRPTHERFGSTLAMVRAAVFVVRRPVTLLHVAVWALAFVAVSALYVWASHGAAMLGTSGAIALLIVREGVTLLRVALKVATIGGQVALGVTRAAPGRPTRSEPE